MALTAEGIDHLKGLTNLTAHLTRHGTRILLRTPNVTEDALAEAKRHPLIRLNSRKGTLGVQPVKHQLELARSAGRGTMPGPGTGGPTSRWSGPACRGLLDLGARWQHDSLML
jgi:hypothetical protein